MKRLRFRNGYETEELATPDQRYEVSIDLRNLAMTFPAGHQLRIDVTSSNYPRFNLNPNSGEALYKPSDTVTTINTVYTGGGAAPSSIFIPVGAKSDVGEVNTSDAVSLSAFPNPAQDIVKFEVTLPAAETISLSLYDGLGRETPVASGKFDAGSHSFSLETKGLAAGHYYGRLLAGEISQTKKIIITK
jgi:hypothetical protein